MYYNVYVGLVSSVTVINIARLFYIR